MPARGKACWHSQFSTYCSWLPGDIRGFRSREHRIHSSGNYRAPPPVWEHRGLREYHKRRHPQPVEIPRARRLRVATAIAETLISLGHRVLTVAVAKKHAHVVSELPIREPEYHQAIGRAKSKSSRTLKDILPGAVWQRDDRHDLLRDRAYQLNAYRYVRDKQGPGAAVWCLDGLRREAERE
jgi:hypothetical protein